MVAFNRERYNARRPSGFSPQQEAWLRQELQAVQRSIPHAQEVDLRDFGSVGTGNDDSGPLANWARVVQETGDGYIPRGVFVHDGSLTIKPTQGVQEVRIRFDAEAWLAPTAGWGLKCEDAYKTVLEKPRVRINSGSTATRGIWMERSRWSSLYKPVVWSFVEIPSGFTCIDIDDNTYWCEVQFPVIRKNSGSITSNFARGVRFTDVSNACTIWGGSINHCDDGAYIDGINGCRVIGTAFEDCTDGVEVAEGAAGPNGHIVAFCRFEAVTNDVNISATTIVANGWPVQIFGTVYTSNNTILNPNGLPIHTRSVGGVRVRASDQAFELRNGVVNWRDSGGSGILEANGNVTINSDRDANGAGTVRVQCGGVQELEITPTGATFSDTVTADYYLDVSISPAQITANTNNYAPTGHASGTWRLNADASRNITGIANGVANRHLRIINVGANDIVLQNQNAGSADANKIITGTGADITVLPDDVVNLWYDGTTARWRVVSHY